MGKDKKKEVKKESIGIVSIWIPVSVVNMNLSHSYYKTQSEYMCVVKAEPVSLNSM